MHAGRTTIATDALIRQATDRSATPQERLRAFEEIVRDHQDMAYGYAYGLLGNAHLAEDAAQEAFIVAWQRLENVRNAAAFPGWLRRVVRTQCDRVTRRKRVPTVPLEEAAHVGLAGPAWTAISRRRRCGPACPRRFAHCRRRRGLRRPCITWTGTRRTKSPGSSGSTQGQ